MNNSSAEFRRLQWRCRRGLLEWDILLNDFLEQRYPHLTPEEQGDFARLVEATDDDELMNFLRKQHVFPHGFPTH